MEKVQNTIAGGTLVAVYAEMAKDDPENIKNILVSNFDIFTAPAQFQKLFFTLLCASDNFVSIVSELAAQAEDLQSVCAKTLTYKDVAWKCETCELDPTCIICAECFEKSNHEGHKIRLQRGASGCCDCGDPTAWKPEGFCTDHQGYKDYSDAEVAQLLPEGMGDRCLATFNACGEYLHSKFLEIEKGTDAQSNLQVQITGTLQCLSGCLEISPMFIHYLTKMLMNIYPQVDKKTMHRCAVLAYVDEDHKEACEELLQDYDTETIDENDSHRCRCSLMSLIFKCKSSAYSKIISDSIIFKMFQSFRFKVVLGLNYAANINSLLNGVNREDSYIHFGVQILTIPEIALKILQDDSLKKIMFKQFETMCSIDKDTEKDVRRKFFWFITDFKYLLKGQTIEYLLQNDGLDYFLNSYAKFSMNDAIEARTEHIFMEEEGYFFDNLDYAYNIIRPGYSMIKEIDYTDLGLNQRIATLFVNSIMPLQTKYNQHSKDGFLNIPIVKCFTMYLTRYLMTNLTLVDATIMDSETSPHHTLKKKMRNLLELLFSQHNDEDVDKVINICMKLAARVLGFNDEIRSSKWHNYGLSISSIPKICSEVLGHFFNDPCFVMTQLAFLLSQNPSELLEQFIDSYSIDDSMVKIFHGVLASPDTYAHTSKDDKKDASNLRQLLYLVITLLSNDREILYFWNSQKEFLQYEYDSKVDDVKQKGFNKASKYEAVHALIKECDSNIKALLKYAPKQMAKSEVFEKDLNEYSRCTTDRDGKKIFSLAQKYIDHYNSFYYKNINDHTEAMKTFDTFYKKKSESKDKKKNGADANKDPLHLKNSSVMFYVASIREAILNTQLSEFLLNLIKYADTYEFINDDVVEYAFYILSLLLDYAQHAKQNTIDNENLVEFDALLSREAAYIQGLSETNSNKSFLDAYFVYIGPESSEILQSKKEETKSQAQKDKEKKLMMQKRKQAVMKKMQKKRAAIAEKYIVDTGTSSANDSMSNASEQDMTEIHKCQQCYEPLYPEEFSEKPYGYLASVVKTKLLQQSYKQTYEKQKEVDLRMSSDQAHNDAVKKLSYTGESLAKASFLDKYGNGLILQTCKHLIHYECLNNFKVKNIENRSRTLLIEDMNVSEFSCPFCKRYSNTILPPWKELIELGAINLDFSDMMSYDGKPKESSKKEKFNQLFEMLRTNLFGMSGSANMNQAVKSSVLSMLLDIVNAIRSKSNCSEDQHDILPVDIQLKKQQIVESIIGYANHNIQLADVKGLSWILSEKEKLRSLILGSQLLCSYMPEGQEEPTPVIFEEQKMAGSLFELNVSSLAVDMILKLYFQATLGGETLESSMISKILKVCYALLLLQISARALYQQNGYIIKNPCEVLTMEKLCKVLKDKDFKITVSSQSVDISTIIAEDSLSFLRKAVAVVYITQGIDQSEDSHSSHAKLLKRLSNQNFSCEPKTELLMLINLLGWLEQETDEIDYYYVVEQVQYIDQKNEISMVKQLKDYFDSLSNSSMMEVDQAQSQSDDLDMQVDNDEEEKIETSAAESSQSQVAKRDPTTIPEVLYLLTPDFYLTLPKLPETLELLTKEYYSKPCMNCKSPSKRGAICLCCKHYCCVAKCNLDLTTKDYKIGALTKHSVFCSSNKLESEKELISKASGDIYNEGACVYLDPVEGKLMYVYNGLAIESPSPYMNKYGECFDENDKNYDIFTLNEEQYGKIRNQILNVDIPNFVVTKRAAKSKVFRQNVL